MIKRISLLLIVIFNTFLSQGQSTTTVLKEKSLVKGQTIYLNSKARLGGKNRIVVPIRLPANTVAWYYSFTTVTTNNAKQHVPGSGLQMQIAKLITDGALNLISAGLVTNIVSQLIKPTGSGAVDVYLTDANGLKQFERKDLVGMYAVNVPTFYSEGTAQNSRNGVFQIPIIRNDLSLCLRNPSVTEGVAVSVDVVAIVSSKEYRDIWSTKNISSIYDDCLNKFSVKDAEAEKACNCAKSKVSTSYKPSFYLALSDSKRTDVLQEAMKRCLQESDSSGISGKEKRIQEITELVKGQEITKEYAGAVRSYNELIILGANSWQNYNGLAYNQLRLGLFEDARKNITTGLGKNPEDLSLLANLGNYYLLTNKYDQALQIFQKYKNKKRSDKKKFKDILSEDLKEFERLGFDNVYFNKTRQDLKIK
ncbi:tetratricopeptide repeat protein [Dyadobacter psychrotolerans]|uniref:Uncharacterized protein n=1 Tax=Dyadobacter psychrotolerans TaxID=2541721 RepID=A0A4R5DWH8_9BACT|nr:hypothetical protein [Dyadobacter psychrotolerans]TDE15635.1 hypothetical protein E0F88_14140 [Dyadobacter psychrotolerans]